MSVLKVNQISNFNDNGPVQFTTGVNSSSAITGDFSVNTSGIVTSTQLNISNMNASGIVTASTFVGNGSLLQNVPGIPNAKGIAYSIIT
jgi:hypothetical protein